MNATMAQAWEPLLPFIARQRDMMGEASQPHIDLSIVISSEPSWEMASTSATVVSHSDTRRPQLSKQVAVVLRLQIPQTNYSAAHQSPPKISHPCNPGNPHGQPLTDLCPQQPFSSRVFEGMLVNFCTS